MRLSILPLKLSNKGIDLQIGTFWDRVYTASEIKRMELTVLAALEWRTLAVTPAALLDPLLSSLDVQPAGYDESAWLELRYNLREHCLLLLARALQGGNPKYACWL